MVLSFNDNFEVVWQDPSNQERNWGFDRLHYPRPQAPLTQAIFERIMSLAFGLPTIFVNNYAFMLEYGPPSTPPEVEEKGPAFMWEVYLPRVKEHCRSVRSAGYDAKSAVELAASIDGIFTSTAETFRMTVVLILAYLRPMAALVAFCEAESGEDGAGLAARLMQGFANETAAAGYGLSELTELAAGLPSVSEALRAGRFSGIELLEGGAEFISHLQAYLDEFGWRAESWALPHVPTWAEEPSVPIALIARYLETPERSPAAALSRSIEERRSAEREVESRLGPHKLADFRRVLALSDAHVPISEARALWQLLIIGSVRVPVIALGRKFVAAGVIDESNDTFFLKLAELSDLAGSPRPMQDEVRARKLELQRCENLTPPSYLGVPASMDRAPPDLRAVMRHLRGYGVVASQEETVIKGMGASKGVVRGRARVLRGLDEAHRLMEGDILVCRTTAPPWTPLFSIAAAVVTDAGGILSHSAICAREYGIAAVVGTNVGTTRIPDGAMVVVDGSKGTVTLEV